MSRILLNFYMLLLISCTGTLRKLVGQCNQDGEKMVYLDFLYRNGKKIAAFYLLQHVKECSVVALAVTLHSNFLRLHFQPFGQPLRR